MNRLLIVLASLLLACAGHAETISALKLAGVPYISLTDVALTLGYSTSTSAGSLTLRTDSGILVVFEGSPDAYWRSGSSQASLEESATSFSLPVHRQGEQWYAPEEVLLLLGLRLEGNVLLLPQGRFTLDYPPDSPAASGLGGYEIVELGHRAYGLSLYGVGTAGVDTLSLLLVDVGVLSLVFPEQQRELDAFMSTLDGGRPLYFVVTSVADGPWETSITFRQDGRSFVAQPPYDLSILDGERGLVGPDRPVSGIVVLPDAFNLRAPMTVQWGSSIAEFQFKQ
jgi:hypothetical protein